MNDDWRLRVELGEHGLEVAEHLEASELEHDLKASFHDRVIVSIDDSELFCYTATREQAEPVAQLLRSLAADRGWQLDIKLEHWHPVAERWEDPDVPLPADDAQRAAEYRERIESERADSAAQGYPEFEVRVRCPSRRESGRFAATLRAEGIPTVQRGRFLLVGAADEDSAKALAQRLRAEAPEGSEVSDELSLRAVMETRPLSPFALFGGLGG